MTDNAAFTAEGLSGLSTLRETVERITRDEATRHDHLDADALSIDTMYIVGSVGADQGRPGSDLDLVVMLSYSGDTTGEYDWLEYVQHDVEAALQEKRRSLAAPLPEGIRYVDPKLGDRFDCEAFLNNMLSHGGYSKAYDLYENAYIGADRF